MQTVAGVCIARLADSIAPAGPQVVWLAAARPRRSLSRAALLPQRVARGRHGNLSAVTTRKAAQARQAGGVFHWLSARCIPVRMS